MPSVAVTCQRGSFAADGASAMAPGPRAQIDDARIGGQGQFEGALDDELGLGARHEHIGGHCEIERPESLGADEVGERLASCVAR